MRKSKTNTFFVTKLVELEESWNAQFQESERLTGVIRDVLKGGWYE